MKKVILILMVSLANLALMAQPPAGDANKGDFYGEKITPNGAIGVSELLPKLKEGEALTTKIKGKVVASCPKKGCWIQLEQAENQTPVFIKFKDYAFFVPTAIVGKTVVLSGEASQKTITVSELKHYAQDAKKSQAEIDAIKEPEKQVRFTADGVLVI